MSAMNGLYSKVAGDPILQQKFSQIMAEAEQAGQTGDPSGTAATEEKLLAFAREAGFEVSTQEMQAFFQGMTAQAEGELSEAELDQVAGGKVNPSVVIASVFTLGIVCAAGSIADAVNGISNCGKFFHQTPSSEGA